MPLFHHNHSEKNIYVKGIAADTEQSGKYGFKDENRVCEHSLTNNLFEDMNHCTYPVSTNEHYNHYNQTNKAISH